MTDTPPMDTTKDSRLELATGMNRDELDAYDQHFNEVTRLLER